MKLNVFIPHRWNNADYAELSSLLERTKFNVRDYSVPASSPFDYIDRRFNVDPQIRKQIQYASVVVCSNRPANSNGMAIDEMNFSQVLGTVAGYDTLLVVTKTNADAEIIIKTLRSL